MIGCAIMYRKELLDLAWVRCRMCVVALLGVFIHHNQSALHTSSIAVLRRDLCDWYRVGRISGHGRCAGRRLRSKSGVPGVSFSLLPFTSR